MSFKVFKTPILITGVYNLTFFLLLHGLPKPSTIHSVQHDVQHDVFEDENRQII